MDADAAPGSAAESDGAGVPFGPRMPEPAKSGDPDRGLPGAGRGAVVAGKADGNEPCARLPSSSCSCWTFPSAVMVMSRFESIHLADARPHRPHIRIYGRLHLRGQRSQRRQHLVGMFFHLVHDVECLPGSLERRRQCAPRPARIKRVVRSTPESNKSDTNCHTYAEQSNHVGKQLNRDEKQRNMGEIREQSVSSRLLFPFDLILVDPLDMSANYNKQDNIKPDEVPH